jgi:hypothetical protein
MVFSRVNIYHFTKNYAICEAIFKKIAAPPCTPGVLSGGLCPHATPRSACGGQYRLRLKKLTSCCPTLHKFLAPSLAVLRGLAQFFFVLRATRNQSSFLGLRDQWFLRVSLYSVVEYVVPMQLGFLCGAICGACALYLRLFSDRKGPQRPPPARKAVIQKATGGVSSVVFPNAVSSVQVALTRPHKADKARGQNDAHTR